MQHSGIRKVVWREIYQGGGYIRLAKSRNCDFWGLPKHSYFMPEVFVVIYGAYQNKFY